jgi:hypothetical protein
MFNCPILGRPGAALRALALAVALPATAGADVVISNNLTEATGGTEAATGNTWLAASFGTDAAGDTLTAVTLELANSVAGQASVSIYADDGLDEPGALVGTLASPGSYSGTLANDTFTSSGIKLAGSSTYWVVLKATSGEFDWGWASDSAGTGAGFQGVWGDSPDAGSTWFTDDSFPLQMSVSVASTSVPEPGTLALCGVGGVALLIGYGLRRRLQRVRLAALPTPAPAA